MRQDLIASALTFAARGQVKGNALHHSRAAKLSPQSIDGSFGLFVFGGALINEIAMVGILRIGEIAHANANETEAGAIRFTLQQLARMFKDAGGELGRFVQRACAGAQFEVGCLEFQRHRATGNFAMFETR